MVRLRFPHEEPPPCRARARWLLPQLGWQPSLRWLAWSTWARLPRRQPPPSSWYGASVIGGGGAPVQATAVAARRHGGAGATRMCSVATQQLLIRWHLGRRFAPHAPHTSCSSGLLQLRSWGAGGGHGQLWSDLADPVAVVWGPVAYCFPSCGGRFFYFAGASLPTELVFCALQFSARCIA